MKRAPNNFQAAGALGEQLTFIDPAPFSPNHSAQATSRTSGMQCGTGRVHQLLFSACTCCMSVGSLCLACQRWHRHQDAVVKRLSAWRVAR